MVEVKEVKFILKTPITYHEKGSVKETYELIMRAPSFNAYRHISALKEGFFKKLSLLKDAQKDKSVPSAADSNEIPSGEILFNMLYVGGDFDMSRYISSFISLCEMGAVIFPDGSAITNSTFNTMPYEEVERLVGEYLANFILGSLLQQMKGIK